MAKKFSIGLTIFVIVMTTIIMILGYQIEGVNTTVLWCLFIPLVIIRTIRSILLMNLKSNHGKYSNKKS